MVHLAVVGGPVYYDYYIYIVLYRQTATAGLGRTAQPRMRVCMSVYEWRPQSIPGCNRNLRVDQFLSLVVLRAQRFDTHGLLNRTSALASRRRVPRVID